MSDQLKRCGGGAARLTTRSTPILVNTVHHGPTAFAYKYSPNYLRRVRLLQHQRELPVTPIVHSGVRPDSNQANSWRARNDGSRRRPTSRYGRARAERTAQNVTSNAPPVSARRGRSRPLAAGCRDRRWVHDGPAEVPLKRNGPPETSNGSSNVPSGMRGDDGGSTGRRREGKSCSAGILGTRRDALRWL